MKILHIKSINGQWIIKFINNLTYVPLYFLDTYCKNTNWKIVAEQFKVKCNYKNIVSHQIIKEYKNIEEVLNDIPELILL